ncbi:MAG: transcriptional activator NhaR [Pseudomonadota bacterium]
MTLPREAWRDPTYDRPDTDILPAARRKKPRIGRSGCYHSPMRHLNYNHLLYFWTVAREGSIAKASEVLHLTPQTISGQLKLLDESVGQSLFNRAGRRLVLSDIGQVVFEYADEIFSVGAELANVVRSKRLSGPKTLNVGMVSSLPKLIGERIIAPALTSENPIRVRCHEASLESLLSELAIHRLDIVLSDQPVPDGLSLKAYHHRLGTSGMSFFANKGSARRYRTRFPESLTNAPMLLPSQNSALRRRLDDWFEAHEILPRIAGEFDDSALLKAFGEAGVGLFAAPTVIEEEICRMYRMSVVGQTNEIEERFYAISSERKLKHESVLHITNTARSDLFG